jgi:hypothetical protein
MFFSNYFSPSTQPSGDELNKGPDLKQNPRKQIGASAVGFIVNGASAAANTQSQMSSGTNIRDRFVFSQNDRGDRFVSVEEHVSEKNNWGPSKVRVLKPTDWSRAWRSVGDFEGFRFESKGLSHSPSDLVRK